MNAVEELQTKHARYLEFFKQDPENHDILCQLVDLETQLGAFDDARDHLANGLKQWERDPALQYRQATLELACGNPQQAVEILQSMLDAGIDAPAIRYNLGYSCLSVGENERAKALFESVTEEVDTIPEVPLMLSRTLHHLGDLEGAMDKARQYLTKHPGSGEALGILGLLHLDNEEFSKAKDYALKAYAVDSDNREALVTLGSVALEEMESQEAARYFTMATQKHAESGRAWSGAGLVHMMEQELDQAQLALKKAVRYMPGHIGTWHALAWCQIVQGDLEAAEESFNSANEVDHNFGETHGGLAVIAALRGEWENAERLAKVALRLDSESFAARFAQSLSLNRQDPQAAQALIEQMLRSTPTHSGQSLQSMVSTIFSRRRKSTRKEPQNRTK